MLPLSPWAHHCFCRVIGRQVDVPADSMSPNAWMKTLRGRSSSNPRKPSAVASRSSTSPGPAGSRGRAPSFGSTSRYGHALSRMSLLQECRVLGAFQ